MATKIVMPRLTDTMHLGMISYWYNKEGETVRQGEPLFVVETDKASVEVDASVTGVLLKAFVKEGESVAVGGSVAIIGESGEDIQSLLTAVKPTEGEKNGVTLSSKEGPTIKLKASPAARRKAKEENVDLQKVTGSGEGGLITEKDVLKYLEKFRKMPEVSKRYGPEERIHIEGIRRVMADKMALSSHIPQVTTVAETDVSDLLELARETSSTITAFVIRAVLDGLRLYPLINASLDGEEIVVKKYFNVGVSVATPRGLVVPVIHNAETKDIYQISLELARLAKKTRESRPDLEEVSGRTFTVTNSGVFGSLFFTPRINPPESAVLGMGKIMKQPIVLGDQIVARTMMYLCLSYDHRIIDGETAVKFLQTVKKALESPRSLLTRISR